MRKISNTVSRYAVEERGRGEMAEVLIISGTMQDTVFGNPLNRVHNIGGFEIEHGKIGERSPYLLG